MLCPVLGPMPFWPSALHASTRPLHDSSLQSLQRKISAKTKHSSALTSHSPANKDAVQHQLAFCMCHQGLNEPDVLAMTKQHLVVLLGSSHYYLCRAYQLLWILIRSDAHPGTVKLRLFPSKGLHQHTIIAMNHMRESVQGRSKHFYR